MKTDGFLISIEGIDGSGKSSLARGLTLALEAKGYNVLLTREPGGTALGTGLRSILHAERGAVHPLAEFLLFAADRAQHFETVILPALREDTIVISDRMADSSLAYQGYGRGIDKEMICRVNEWAMQGRSPDLTFFIRVDPVTAINRTIQRKAVLTSFEQEDATFWYKVCNGYEDIFKGRDNVVVIDGMLPVGEITRLAVDQSMLAIESE